MVILMEFVWRVARALAVCDNSLAKDRQYAKRESRVTLPLPLFVLLEVLNVKCSP